MIYNSHKTKIPENAITYKFTSSGGPGGQNVNRVSTAVQLRLNIADIEIDEVVKMRLITFAGSRYTNSDEIIISSQNFRTQKDNRDDALKRLIALIQKAEAIPKKRKKIKLSAGKKQKRLDSKKQRSDKKVSRRRVDY
jgi:ribosome-associated protein